MDSSFEHEILFHQITSFFFGEINKPASLDLEQFSMRPSSERERTPRSTKIDCKSVLELLNLMYTSPKISNFQVASEFFREFYKQNHPALSHRKFAAEIGWPVSLLGDMIQGRKRLSINRAIEFSNFLKLDSVQCEHLILLSLKDVENPEVQNFAQSLLKKVSFDRVNPEVFEVVEDTKDYFQERSALRHYLIWSQGRLEYEMLPQHLPSYLSLKDPKFVRERLEEMVRDGIIDQVTPPIQVLKKNILRGGPRRQSFQEGFEAALNLLEARPENTYYAQGVLMFPRSQLLELYNRRCALESWLLATAAVTELPADYNPDDYSIIYASLSIGEVLDHNPESPHRIGKFLAQEDRRAPIKSENKLSCHPGPA
jgi:hypothetical protein